MAESLQRPFAEHVREWAGPGRLLPIVSLPRGPACTRCNLCKGRRNVCLFRGTLPCDVLFIGEAPGESEDALGYPFIGPAGRELDGLVFSAYGMLDLDTTIMLKGGRVGSARDSLTYGITNIIACIPRTEEVYSRGEIRPPKKEEAAACQPRLLEVMQMANPRAIVLLGDVAKRFFPKVLTGLKRWNQKAVCLLHPSAILREEIPANQSRMRKQFVLGLASVLKELT